MNEIYKDIPGYEGKYQVSNLGNVKNIVFNRVFKLGKDDKGYLRASLRKDRKIKSITVHKLVAMAFLNHIPNGHKIVVDHIDNNRLDNRVTNLQLISNRENLSKDKKNKTSKYIGVCWSKQNSKWMSNIYINGKTKYIGYYENEIDASNAYQEKLKEIN